jgi:ABC-type glycerol-3-phosphate transport system permease component
MAANTLPRSRSTGRAKAGALAYNRQGITPRIGRFVIFLLYGIPLAWVVATSFKPESTILKDPSGLMFTPTLEQYRGVVSQVWPAMLNSLQIGIGTTVLTLLVAVPAAYGMARRRTKWWTRVVAITLGLMIILQMVPQAMTIMPLYSILAQWHLTNTILGIVLATSALVMPFAILLIRPFFLTIPPELEEAAIMDGASVWSAFRRVLMPLARNGIVTVGIMVFMQSWGELLYGTTFLSKPDAYPVGALLALQTTLYGTEWGHLMALGVLITLPILVLFIFSQRRLMQGMLSGAVK